MRVGYIRVSTEEQKIDRQEVMMKKLGVEKLFIDKLSGKNTHRPELQRLLDFVREGDIVVVESISRMARNTRDLLNITHMLDEKGVGFVSLKEKFDTTTVSGKFVLVIFAAIAELERGNILQRQREGIEIAKQKGVYKGRKPKELKGFDEIFEKWNNHQISTVEASRTLGISRSTFYRKVNEKIARDGLVKYTDGHDNKNDVA